MGPLRGLLSTGVSDNPVYDVKVLMAIGMATSDVCTFCLQDELYRVMWERSMDDMMARLLNVSIHGNQYVGMIQQNTVFMPRLEHLTCFLPGNLALGVAYGAVSDAKAELYMSLAQNLTYTCWQMYDKMPIGELIHPDKLVSCVMFAFRSS